MRVNPPCARDVDDLGGPDPSRRVFLAGGLSAAAGLVAVPGAGAAVFAPRGAAAAILATKSYPKGFLWGVATAAHQVEGNNLNSDLWVLEQMKPSMFAEPSGDACDHYHRYLEDIRLVASLGFNTYRFSVEWARVEPEPGFFSKAELDHYRRVAAACRENGLLPMVTFWHFTSPRWFAAQGGWESEGASDLFVRYCERTAKHLGDLVGAAATFNEPNIPHLLRWMFAAMPQNPFQGVEPMVQAAARRVGSDRFSYFMFADPDRARDTMLSAHQRAVAAIKSGPGKYPVGVTLAISDDQAASPEQPARRQAGGPLRRVARRRGEERLRRGADLHARAGRQGRRPAARAGRRADADGLRVLARGPRADDSLRRRHGEGTGLRHRERRRDRGRRAPRRVHRAGARRSREVPGRRHRRARVRALVPVRQLRVDAAGTAPSSASSR